MPDLLTKKSTNKYCELQKAYEQHNSAYHNPAEMGKNNVYQPHSNNIHQLYNMWSCLSASVSYSFWSISECSFLFSSVSLELNASLSHAVLSTWMSHNLTILWPGVCVSFPRMKLKTKLNCPCIHHVDVQGSGSIAVLHYLSARWSWVVTFTTWLLYITESVLCIHCVGPRTSLAARKQTIIPWSFSP
jgi:hypothetical protein